MSETLQVLGELGRYRPRGVPRIDPAPVRDVETSISGVFEATTSYLRKLVSNAMRSEDRAAFGRYWEEHWEQFMSADDFFQQIIRQVAAQSPALRKSIDTQYTNTLTRATKQGYSEVIRVAGQTLDAAYELVARIEQLHATGRGPHSDQKDRVYAADFGVGCALYNLGFNCVAEVIDERTPAARDVFEAALELLKRGAAKAYKAAEGGVQLRTGSPAVRATLRLPADALRIMSDVVRANPPPTPTLLRDLQRRR